MAENGNAAGDESNSDPAANGGSANPDGKTFVPPKDGSWVPRDRLNAVSSQLKELRAELQALKAPSKPKPNFSKAELRKAVEEGKLSEDQAEAVWERQTEERIAERLTQDLAVHSQKTAAARTIAEYEAIDPALADEDSDLRHRVVDEYKSLLDLGSPNSEATMVAALRAVCGSVDTFKRSKAAKKGRVLESHDEYEAGDDLGETGANGKPKLSKAERSYYAPLVQRGMYRDWKEVEEMVSKFGKPHLRQMRGA